MMKFVVLFALAAMSSAFADTQKIPKEEPFATIRVPDKWQIKEHPEALETVSPDGAIFFLIATVERNKIAETIGEEMRFMRNRDNILVKTESRHDEDGKINDIKAHFVSWQGKNKKGDVELKFAIIPLAKDQTFVAAYDGAPAAVKKYAAELDKMLHSITKIPGTEEKDEPKAEESKAEKEAKEKRER
jgi:hypothetical protein